MLYVESDIIVYNNMFSTTCGTCITFGTVVYLSRYHFFNYETQKYINLQNTLTLAHTYINLQNLPVYSTSFNLLRVWLWGVVTALLCSPRLGVDILPFFSKTCRCFCRRSSLLSRLLSSTSTILVLPHEQLVFGSAFTLRLLRHTLELRVCTEILPGSVKRD